MPPLLIKSKSGFVEVLNKKVTVLVEGAIEKSNFQVRYLIFLYRKISCIFYRIFFNTTYE